MNWSNLPAPEPRSLEQTYRAMLEQIERERTAPMVRTSVSVIVSPSVFRWLVADGYIDERGHELQWRCDR